MPPTGELLTKPSASASAPLSSSPTSTVAARVKSGIRASALTSCSPGKPATLALAPQYRITHIVAHRLRQHQGQIAVNLGAVAPAQAALQIQHAGEAAIRRAGAPGGAWGRLFGAPAHLRIALRVGIGELQVAQFR